MKKVIPAVFASVLALGIASAFAAAPMKVVSTSDLSGLYAASVTVGLSGPEGQFKEALVSHGATAKIRVASFALGAVDSSKLGNALQVMSVQAPTGISVSFLNVTARAGSDFNVGGKRSSRSYSNATATGFDEYDFYVGVANGVKTGTYPVTVNLHNPLSNNDGSVSFNVIVQ